jgi:rhodanese-related sulfurtransferase
VPRWTPSLFRRLSLKKFLTFFSLAVGIAVAQQPPPSPLDAVPPPLVGALMDLYANYQQNRPHLPTTQEQAAIRALRAQDRTVKVASGVAIGTAVGALVAKPNDRARAAAVGAVAGGLAAWILDHYQVKQEERAAAAAADPGDTSRVQTEPQLKSRF